MLCMHEDSISLVSTETKTTYLGMGYDDEWH